jgi:hypothetical protein
LRGVPVLGDHHFIFSATAQRLSEYLVMVIDAVTLKRQSDDEW